MAGILIDLGDGHRRAARYRRALTVVAHTYPLERPTSRAIRANAASDTGG